jgi:hypothetical protein
MGPSWWSSCWSELLMGFSVKITHNYSRAIRANPWQPVIRTTIKPSVRL